MSARGWGVFPGGYLPKGVCSGGGGRLPRGCLSRKGCLPRRWILCACFRVRVQKLFFEFRKLSFAVGHCRLPYWQWPMRVGHCRLPYRQWPMRVGHCRLPYRQWPKTEFRRRPPPIALPAVAVNSKTVSEL